MAEEGNIISNLNLDNGPVPNGEDTSPAIGLISQYVKDLSVEKFQALMRDRVDQRAEAGPGGVSFDDVTGELESPQRGILFHDGNNRSMEQLMSDQAKNALLHNMVVELLKKQYSAMENALRERVT